MSSVLTGRHVGGGGGKGGGGLGWVSGQSGSEFFFLARGVKVHDPNDPKVGVVGGGAYAPAPHAPSPAAGHPYNPYCPVSWLPALGRLEHLLTVFTAITF